MDHIESIEIGLKEQRSYNEIARKIFLTLPTKALIGDEEKQYLILNEISSHFSVPITSIQVAGSAKTGKSFIKNRDFLPKLSDLDIAIIDPNLYQRYTELIFKITRGYTDRTLFPLKDGKSAAQEFIDYIAKGIFRTDIMPSCRERAEWREFFGQLSRKHFDLFKSINACIYFSETFFESKQRSAIKIYKENKAI